MPDAQSNTPSETLQMKFKIATYNKTLSKKQQYVDDRRYIKTAELIQKMNLIQTFTKTKCNSQPTRN